MSTGYRHAWDDSSLFISSWDETERSPKLGTSAVDDHPWSPTKCTDNDMVQRLSLLSKENHEMRIRSNKAEALEDENYQLRTENEKLRKQNHISDGRKVWPHTSQLDAELSREKRESDRLRRERNDLKYQLEQIRQRNQSKQQEVNQKDKLKEIITALRTEHEASLIDLRKSYEETIAQQRNTIKNLDSEIRMLRNGSAGMTSSMNDSRPSTHRNGMTSFDSFGHNNQSIDSIQPLSAKRHESPPKSPSRSLSPAPTSPTVFSRIPVGGPSKRDGSSNGVVDGDRNMNSFSPSHTLQTRGRAGYHLHVESTSGSVAFPRPVPLLSGRGHSSGEVGIRGTSPAVPTRAQSAHTALPPPRRGSASPGVGESDGVAQLGRLQQRHEDQQRERFTKREMRAPQMLSSPLQKIDGGSGFYTELTGRIHGSRRSESPGHVMSPNIYCGARVLRNPASWKWDDQDGGIGNLGTVIDVDKENGWVVVSWDGVPKKNSYRWGHMGVFDVNIASKKPTTGVASPLGSDSANPALGRSLSPISMRNELKKKEQSSLPKLPFRTPPKLQRIEYSSSSSSSSSV
eukprot:TRINITY_DN11135_c0_g1_i1.p1 TRINITY_DN11135_c0_g1~~TRINITY_DN11135_c0_g1_i1.p1  ORF type:complete len:571 (+),score=108.92 TRINITY_DN11135_c0_g1_i1:59-1771(+)